MLFCLCLNIVSASFSRIFVHSFHSISFFYLHLIVVQRDYEGLLPPPPTATSTATSAFTRDLLDCEDNALAYYRNVARSQFDFSLFPILQMTTQERSLRRQRLVAEARSKSTNGDKNNSGGKASNNSGDDQKNTNVNNTGDEANGSKKTVTMTKGRAVFIAGTYSYVHFFVILNVCFDTDLLLSFMWCWMLHSDSF